MFPEIFVRILSWLLQGLGDLAAHLVAFHNMGASPAHDDPFTSDVKVDFDGDKEEGSDAENSPHAQSQQRNVAGTTFIEDRTFESTAQVLPLMCATNADFQAAVFTRKGMLQFC